MVLVKATWPDIGGVFGKPREVIGAAWRQDPRQIRNQRFPAEAPREARVPSKDRSETEGKQAEFA